VNATRRRLLARAGALLSLPMAAAGCSSGSGGAKSGSAPAATAATGGGAGGTSVVIQNFAFQPPSLTVPAGATVTVVNKDSVTHTLSSTASPSAFDTGDIASGTTTTFKAPAKAGAYPYICKIHTFMHGTLTVQ
jgi:plastocyanin